MENEEAGNQESWDYNRLKKYDTQTLENTIAKAISGLTGLKLECSINEIDYSNENNPLSHNRAKFTVCLDEPVKLNLK